MNSASLSASASPLPASASGPTGQHYALVQAVLRLSRRFQVALSGPLEAQLGLNIKELLVLAAVADGQDTPGQVAAWQGLLERQRDPSDLRRCRLTATPAGLDLRRRARLHAEQTVQQEFGQVEHAAAQALSGLLALEAELKRAAGAPA